MIFLLTRGNHKWTQMKEPPLSISIICLLLFSTAVQIYS